MSDSKKFEGENVKSGDKKTNKNHGKVLKSNPKEIRKNTEYFIGLDIGTSSVGWAVTNTNYEILKFNGKRMWGSRLFNEASTAEERRGHRVNRRRIQRRRDRLNLLEEIFSEEMAKVDPEFFMRLKESKFHLEDKDERILGESNIIFKGSEDGDKKYYEKYPTIYHLRHKLMQSCEDVDIRELYMALHHIIKYRGHFLFKVDFEETGTSIENIIIELLELINNNLGVKKFEYNESLINELKNIVSNTSNTITNKKKLLGEFFNKKEYKAHKSLFILSIGASVKPVDLFLEEEYKDIDDIKNISFKNLEYDQVRDTYESIFLDKIEFIDVAKRLYDATILLSIKPEGKTLSKAKVDIYNKHHNDLELLKKVLKTDKEKYDSILKLDIKKGNNYVNYVKKSKNGISCSKEEFHNALKKVLVKIEKTDDIKYILNEIELERFLPLQRVKDNSVIPYQIHRYELKKILENASKKFTFLNEESDGHTNIEKIIKIMEYRIPYYVGPLNDHHSVYNNGFAWVSRKRSGRITPWNFDEMVDKEESAERFIENLTNKCSYLIGEDVLPKESLLYSEFSLLNELNNIKYDGISLPIDIKKSIIEKIFRVEKKRVTKKSIKEFLKQEGYSDGKGEVSGIDIDIKSDLKSYRDMVKIFGTEIDYRMAENIIKWVTLFGDSKDLLKTKINKEYGEKVRKDQLKKVCKLKYRDWGRLSKKFLTGIRSSVLVNDATGEGYTIIEAMRNTDNNLMQLLRNEYDYLKKIDQINMLSRKDIDEISHDILDDLYCSPAVKRSLWQTIKIVEEIKKIMGHEPKKVFVEVTRTNKADKKTTITRKNRLLELYSAINAESRDWVNELNSTEVSKFNSKKLYLYYTQMGKCMYTGKNIDIESLFTDMYDIDHIFPRSKTKDNSFENLVLVTRKANADKRDVYPIDPKIQTERKSLWDMLHDKKLIGDKKYDRLTRNTGFTDDEMSGFIARQLVETSQASKAAAEMLKLINNDSEIVYVKAENVSDFRHENEFIKVREINDHHHAKDAYLNIVVGNVYNEKFTKNPANYIKKGGGNNYSLNCIFNRNLDRNGKRIWDEKKSIDTVNRMMKSNDVRVTFKNRVDKGPILNKVTIHKASEFMDDGKKNKKGFPIKSSEKNGNNRLCNLYKYGGYKDLNYSHYTIVRYNVYEKKGLDIKYYMIPIPYYLCLCNINQHDYVYDYISNRSKKDVNNIEIIVNELKMGSLINIDGYNYYLGGSKPKTFYVDPAYQIILDKEIERCIKEIVKAKNNEYRFINTDKINKNLNMKIYKYIVNKKIIGVFRNRKWDKGEYLNSSETIEKFSGLSVESQCNVILRLINDMRGSNKGGANSKFDELEMTISRAEIPQTLSNVSSFKIINQSITGLFENEVTIV